MISVALAWLVLAQPVNPYLEEGKRLARELKFAECIEQMRIAGQVLDFSRAEKAQMLTLQARCQIAEGKRALAEESFAQLLELDPGAELDRNESPKILEVFDAVKHRLYPPDFIKLTPQPARPGRATFALIDPWRRVDSVVMVRRVNEAQTELKVATVDGQLSVELDVEAGGSLEWWLEARAAAGQVLFSYGNGLSPQRYSVATIDTGPAVVDTRTPRAERVSAWIAVVLAVAAGATGAVLQVQSLNHAAQARDLSRPPGDWAYTARATYSTAVTEASVATGLFVGAGVAGSAGVVLFTW